MKHSKRPFKLAAHYAHRGYHNKPQIPENSMAAFRRAVEYGLPSEFDVHLIADGSLVIFHDDDLERQTGVKGSIEAYDITNLRRLRLEGTDEVIPTFDEVLDLYENTGLPLLIELKCVKGNHKALARAVAERLDRYKGEYVIESFDPRALIEYRRLRPEVIRGQLSQDFFRSREGLPFYQVVMLTNLMLNWLTKPDFIAYKFEDRKNCVLRSIISRKDYDEVSWTIKSADEFRDALRDGSIPVFEQITPEELRELTQGGGREV
ncbi:MAG: glycerophosphodiester phosphodiesterase [Mogibacterium sp.]|nr:glycerophosphodiester phosphodiesterase [Mogibacterium sp.]